MLSHISSITDPADRAFNTSPLLKTAERASASLSTPDVYTFQMFVSLNATVI